MNTLAIEVNTKIRAVDIDDDFLGVTLMDGRIIYTPLAWYPKLLNASQEEREKWQICGAGQGLHWESLDEDLSVDGMLKRYS